MYLEIQIGNMKIFSLQQISKLKSWLIAQVLTLNTFLRITVSVNQNCRSLPQTLKADLQSVQGCPLVSGATKYAMVSPNSWKWLPFSNMLKDKVAFLVRSSGENNTNIYVSSKQLYYLLNVFQEYAGF